MTAARVQLIFCLGANRVYPALARAAGWRVGARLPCTLYADHQPLAFADQDWRQFDGLTPGQSRYETALARYVAAVAQARPAMASVVDWTEERTAAEIARWAALIAPYVGVIMVIPKIPGSVSSIPRTLAGRSVRLGFSVPTRHGATPCDPAEFAGWPVHLLGGNPRQQLMYAGLLATHGAQIISADGNLTHHAAGRGTFWEHGKARNLGARVLTTEDALRRSLAWVPQMWRDAGWLVNDDAPTPPPADLADRLARRGWALAPHPAGWELTGNGAPAIFGRLEAVREWLGRLRDKEDGDDERRTAAGV